MGREIELKIPLNENQFLEIYNKIFKNQTSSEKKCFFDQKVLLKKDEYFSQFDNREEREKNEPRVIRLRSEKEVNDFPFESCRNIQEISAKLKEAKEKSGDCKAFFTIKSKNIENGIEFNKEDETFIQDADVLRLFFEKTRFNCWFKKEKNAFSSVFKGNLEFHIELEIVNGLFYIEIEYTNEETDSSSVAKELENLVRSLNLDPAKKDKRSWKEIISDGQNNA